MDMKGSESSSKKKSSTHGGDIYNNKVKYDFSVNLNPLGVPDSVREAVSKSVDIIEKYPDINNESLKRAVCGYFAVKYECTAVGNGASELIMAAFNAIKPSVLITPAPDFSGYMRAAASVGCRVQFVNIIRESGVLLSDEEAVGLLKNKLDEVALGGDRRGMVVLSNPNNPTGALTDRALLAGLAEKCREKGFILGIDESFMPFVKDRDIQSMKDRIEEGSLVVFRSCTKIFSMPGVRLGVLLAAKDLIAKVEGALPEWNISAAASAAGEAALKESAYIDRTPGFVEAQREYLCGCFKTLGLRAYPSSANYILVYCEKELYEPLLQRGILIRDCSNYEGLGQGFYRFAVRTHEENGILVEKLREILEG
ncbi:MAG: aminotransferase class I/II-fold pyridoxal phosphate-dependent enzyme [Lachnospiraceae bacterium]|nr:aminotransferase class I/II-fold pyridoxal phosphate-dependent enzyme [Lachnospiraceae bacterium]